VTSLKLHPDVRYKVDNRGRAILKVTCTVKSAAGVGRRIRVMCKQMPSASYNARHFGYVLLQEVNIPEDWTPHQAVEVIEGVLDLFEVVNNLHYVLEDDRLGVLRRGIWQRKPGQKIEEEFVPVARRIEREARAQAKDTPRR
jgi:hypothetical protein